MSLIVPVGEGYDLKWTTVGDVAEMMPSNRWCTLMYRNANRKIETYHYTGEELMHDKKARTYWNCRVLCMYASNNDLILEIVLWK